MKNEVIWITGASSGIGRQLALQYANAGNHVFVSARSRDKLLSLAETAAVGAISVVPCDITDSMSMQNAAKKIQAEVGYLDKVIINAGTCEYFSVQKPDWQMAARVMDVNFHGAVNTLATALPLLRAAPNNNSAHIVVVASLASVVPFSRAQAYGASKAALKYFFESMRVDLHVENIAVTVVQPGFVATPLTAQNDFPMPFMISVEKAASIIIRRLTSKPRLIRFPRRLAWLLLLMAHLPWLWHQIVTKPLRSAEPSRSDTSSDTSNNTGKSENGNNNSCQRHLENG